jgi:alpha-galactosidase
MEKEPKLKGKLYAGMCAGDDHQMHMGPELGFGWSVGDAFNTDGTNDKVLLVKIAWGGKSLEVDFRPPSSGVALVCTIAIAL